MKGTIKSAEEISLLFASAQKVTTTSLIARIAPSAHQTTESGRDPVGRVAFVAGKRLGAAPLRSRAKRRMREAARVAGAPWAGIDVVFVARERTAHTPYTQLLEDMERVCKRVVGEQEQNRLKTR